MTELNLDNLKQRLPFIGVGLALVLLLICLWFLVNYFILFLTPKVPEPVISTSLNQNLLASNVAVTSSLKTFANFKKAIYYKKNSEEKIDTANIARKLGFTASASKKGDSLSWAKGEENLEINPKSLYLEYKFDTTKNKAFYQTGSKPLLDKAKLDFKTLLSQLKLSSNFINLEKPLATYSQGLQGLSEINPKLNTISPSQATTIVLTYQLSFAGRPLFGDYPEVINASAQYSLNNRLIYLKIPLILGTWVEDRSYEPFSANELVGAVSRKEATLVSYNYLNTAVGRAKEPIKVLKLKKITTGFLVSTDALFPTYLVESDGFTESGLTANAVFYLPAISAKFFTND